MITLSLASGGGTPKRPQKSEKLLEKTDFIFQRCIYNVALDKRQKFQKYLVKIMKKSIFHKDFDQKGHLFRSKRANFYRQFLKFPCLLEIIRQKLIIFNFSTNTVDFLHNFQEFSFY